MASDPGKNQILADELYTACLSRPSVAVWKQEDLLSLGVVSDVDKLMPLLDLLSKQSKFQARSVDNDTAVAFTVRERSVVSKYASITDSNARNIYRLIENAGTAGMWKATLKQKLKLHENVVEKALRSLQGTKHIKQLKSARSNAKKTFMLYELEPTKEVTGGGWYSDGEIDYELIEVASRLVVLFVRKRSWLPGPRLPKLPSKVSSSKTGDKRKRGAQDVEEVGDSEHDFDEQAVKESRTQAATDNGRILVPFPAGYKDYPTASTILDHIDESGVIQKDLTLQDMKDLLDRLVFDGQLEKMSLKSRAKRERMEEVEEGETDEQREVNAAKETAGEEIGYRWVRRPDSEWNGVAGDSFSWDLGMKLPKNGFSETPCSRCPVFNLCQEGGPVDAQSCAYLKEWF